MTLGRPIKLLSLSLLLLAEVAVTTSRPALAQDGRAKGQFYCGQDQGVPATIASNGTRELVFVRWTQAFSNGWNPQRRCEQVSMKFQQNTDSGNLTVIVPGRANGYNVLCASSQPVSDVINCPDQRILMTLRSSDDPNAWVKYMYDVNTGRQVDPQSHSYPLKRVRGIYNLNVRRMFNYSPPVQQP